MSKADRRKKIIEQIEELKKQISEVGTEIEKERNESSEEDSAIRQDLLDKKEILEQKIIELQEALILLNNSDQLPEDIGKMYSIEVNGLNRELSIVLPNEADPSKGQISMDSPLAKALLGRKKGEQVNVETPAGTQTYRIINIK